MEAVELKKIIHAVLDERDTLDHETHSDHHRFIGVLLDREQRRRELRDSIKKQVLGWGAIVFVTGIGTAAYKIVVEIFQKGAH